jgi:hypothetical protein
MLPRIQFYLVPSGTHESKLSWSLRVEEPSRPDGKLGRHWPLPPAISRPLGQSDADCPRTGKVTLTP